MLYTKYEISGPCSFRQDFRKLHLENLFFDPVTYLCNQLETVWTTIVKEHLEIIPVKFGKNPMSGFRGEVVWMKMFTHARTHSRTHACTDGWRTKDCHNSSFEHFVLRWAKNTTPKTKEYNSNLPLVAFWIHFELFKRLKLCFLNKSHLIAQTPI